MTIPNSKNVFRKLKYVLPLNAISRDDRDRVGGKGFALGMMAQNDIRVPDALCICSDAYNFYVTQTGLRERILLELSRKRFDEMRWEEIWDASLRIRNMFLKTPIPSEINEELRASLNSYFADKPVVVRSSAPGEDSARASFAGLHDSYVNIQGTDSILEHIRRVWSSLWSDAALLYRRELGLNIEKSTMAVVVQEIVVGEYSGVYFSKNPNDDSQAMIEAVYGLNQGLVDGTVEPDRWSLDRENGLIISHTAATRSMHMVPSPEGVKLEPLLAEQRQIPPLKKNQLISIFEIAQKAEKYFRVPQDIEWTFRQGNLYILQARPITTLSSGEFEDKRPWYLSLRRSFENLKLLRSKIEKELVPAMKKQRALLADKNLQMLSDADLAHCISKRSAIFEKWTDVYWSEFIPFAHGMRLFGQIYNDLMKPDDPYEFMELLGAGQLESLQRNQMLEDLVSIIKNDPDLYQNLKKGRLTDSSFKTQFNDFMKRYGNLSYGSSEPAEQGPVVIRLLLSMADRKGPGKRHAHKDRDRLTRNFFSRFHVEQEKEYARDLLDLARDSYRLRDDDNIYLGKIENELNRAVLEGKKRLKEREITSTRKLPASDVAQCLKDPEYHPKIKPHTKQVEKNFKLKARQLTGQPAGPGICRGKARVILDASHLFDFKDGEILVCDALDPNITFVVPLTAGIVERRGGMLIHGAIIAREYGLPCVTGVPDATRLIKTGDTLTVDGYLGIVIVH